MNKDVLAIIGSYIREDRPKMWLYWFKDIWSYQNIFDDVHLKEAKDIDTLYTHIYKKHKEVIRRNMNQIYDVPEHETQFTLLNSAINVGYLKIREITEY